MALNRTIEKTIMKSVEQYSWEYKRFAADQMVQDFTNDLIRFYRRQNMGVNRTNRVNTSSRPKSIATHKIHFAWVGMDS